MTVEASPEIRRKVLSKNEAEKTKEFVEYFVQGEKAFEALSSVSGSDNTSNFNRFRQVLRSSDDEVSRISPISISDDFENVGWGTHFVQKCQNALSSLHLKSEWNSFSGDYLRKIDVYQAILLGFGVGALKSGDIKLGVNAAFSGTRGSDIFSAPSLMSAISSFDQEKKSEIAIEFESLKTQNNALRAWQV